MIKDIEKIVKMRMDGMSQEAIAAELGVTKQCIQQKLARFAGGAARPYKYEQIIYPGIREYMEDHGLSFAALERKTSVPKNTLIRKLSGRAALFMQEINDLIDITGLSYEQLFRK